jgi:GNAT superfamily N-acetyltransferase
MTAQDLPIGLVLRPARLQDARSVMRLGQRLASEAMHGPWVKRWRWIGLSGLGLGLGLGGAWGLAHPAAAGLFGLALLPIWLPILLLAIVAQRQPHEHWQRYWVVEQVDGPTWQFARSPFPSRIVACGRIDRSDQHAELYDLYVIPAWRGQGVGRVLVEQLMAQATRPLYLACLPTAVGFYQRFGFVPIGSETLPGVLRARLSFLNPRLTRLGLQAMVLYRG